MNAKFTLLFLHLLNQILFPLLFLPFSRLYVRIIVLEYVGLNDPIVSVMNILRGYLRMLSLRIVDLILNVH
jgi:hypothetical protein